MRFPAWVMDTMYTFVSSLFLSEDVMNLVMPLKAMVVKTENQIKGTVQVTIWRLVTLKQLIKLIV